MDENSNPEFQRQTHPSHPVEADFNLVRRYLSELWKTLVHPIQFFRSLPPEGGLAGPLAFALVTHWLGALVSFVWNGLSWQRAMVMYSGALDRLKDRFGPEVDQIGRSDFFGNARDTFSAWFLSAGSIIVDPFFTLLQIFSTSFFVYLAARILVTPGRFGSLNQITYESAVRVVCYSLAASALYIVPFVGPIFVWLYSGILLILGAREMYRVETFSATLIGLAPHFFLFLVFGIPLFLILLLAAGVLISL